MQDHSLDTSFSVWKPAACFGYMQPLSGCTEKVNKQTYNTKYPKNVAGLHTEKVGFRL